MQFLMRLAKWMHIIELILHEHTHTIIEDMIVLGILVDYIGT